MPAAAACMHPEGVCICMPRRGCIYVTKGAYMHMHACVHTRHVCAREGEVCTQTPSHTLPLQFRPKITACRCESAADAAACVYRPIPYPSQN